MASAEATSAASACRRVFTKITEPVRNFGYDTADGDYICVSGDTVLGPEGSEYDVQARLGHGTFGQVLRCGLANSSPVAIKIIRNKPAYFQQALVEVKILQILNRQFDTRVVKIQDFFVFRKHLCIVFEMLDVNLYEVLRHNGFKGLPVPLIRVFADQLLKALVCLRSQGIMHCDLKPENILLVNRRAAKIKIIDFGSAAFVGEQSYTYIQSRFYRSIEVILGLQPFTTAIDMWSLGCILAELFMGVPLLPGSNEFDQLQRISALCGHPPGSMLSRGRHTGKFYSMELGPAPGAPCQWCNGTGMIESWNDALSWRSGFDSPACMPPTLTPFTGVEPLPSLSVGTECSCQQAGANRSVMWRPHSKAEYDEAVGRMRNAAKQGNTVSTPKRVVPGNASEVGFGRGRCSSGVMTNFTPTRGQVEPWTMMQQDHSPAAVHLGSLTPSSCGFEFGGNARGERDRAYAGSTASNDYAPLRNLMLSVRAQQEQQQANSSGTGISGSSEFEQGQQRWLIHLVSLCLRLDPERRLTPCQGLYHPLFTHYHRGSAGQAGQGHAGNIQPGSRSRAPDAPFGRHTEDASPGRASASSFRTQGESSPDYLRPPTSNGYGSQQTGYPSPCSRAGQLCWSPPADELCRRTILNDKDSFLYTSGSGTGMTSMAQPTGSEPDATAGSSGHAAGQQTSVSSGAATGQNVTGEKSTRLQNFALINSGSGINPSGGVSKRRSSFCEGTTGAGNTGKENSGVGANGQSSTGSLRRPSLGGFGSQSTARLPVKAFTGMAIPDDSMPVSYRPPVAQVPDSYFYGFVQGKLSSAGAPLPPGVSPPVYSAQFSSRPAQLSGFGQNSGQPCNPNGGNQSGGNQYGGNQNSGNQYGGNQHNGTHYQPHSGQGPYSGYSSGASAQYLGGQSLGSNSQSQGAHPYANSQSYSLPQGSVSIPTMHNSGNMSIPSARIASLTPVYPNTPISHSGGSMHSRMGHSASRVPVYGSSLVGGSPSHGPLKCPSMSALSGQRGMTPGTPSSALGFTGLGHGHSSSSQHGASRIPTMSTLMNNNSRPH